MAKPQPVFTSRSQFLTGLDCPQQRAWNFHYSADGLWNGPGIQPTQRPSYFELGTLIHEALEAVAQGEDPQAVREQIWEFQNRADYLDFGHGETNDPNILVREQATFVEAVMWLWFKVRLPVLMEEYELVQVEKGLEVQLGELSCNCGFGLNPQPECDKCAGTGIRPLIWQSKPDLLWRRRRDQALFVMDLKSSGSRDKPADIDHKFQHSTLFHAQMAAVEAEFGEPCIGFMYEGIYKGYQEQKVHKDLGYKRQMSPLIYAYYTEDDGLSGMKLSADNWRTGRPTLLCDLPMSIKDYVYNLEEAIQQKQFVIPPPLGIDPRKVARWREQVPAEEARWLNPKAPFAQNDGHCFRYGIKRHCQYLKACYSEAVRADPLGSGDYVVREPHHEGERLALEEK
jgi:hypothetical protein